MEIIDAVKIAHDALDDRKGESIKVLDVQNLTPITDYFLIATGNNINHVKTLAHAVEEKLAEQSVFLRHKEGHQSATWILLDFGNFIVHVFGKEEREFYDIEHIWGDAPVVTF